MEPASPSSPLFQDAAEQWRLQQLYGDLAVAKAKVMPQRRPELTEVERERLRGLLLGFSPAAIAERQYTAPRTVEVALSQGLYRYVELLTGRDRNSLDSWRDIVGWLEAAGYRCRQVAINWEQMPDVPLLYGRERELEQLQGWVLGQGEASLPCRLIAINGPAGIGKTSLAICLAQQLRSQFDGVIWQSLRHKPKLEHLLGQWLQQLPQTRRVPEQQFSGQQFSGQQFSGQQFSGQQWYDQASAVMDYLRRHRCLVLLDNLETILSSGSLIGEYERDYQAYGEFLRRIGEEQHQSCVIVTSRESNRDIRGATAAPSAQSQPIRHLSLQGLDYDAAAQLLATAALSDERYWKALVQQYRGNPLMLRIVALTIDEIFDGDVHRFLQPRMTLFGAIKYLIDQQYDRLSEAEQEVLVQLAQQAEPMAIEALMAQSENVERLPAINALLRRSLIEKSPAGFSLRPIVMEYVRQSFA